MERAKVEDLVSATARLCLWLAGDLEPVSIDVAEQDLDSLYELCIAVERLGRSTFGERWTE